MNRRRPERSTLGRFGAALRQHFADPTFYARRFRASRLGGRSVTPAPGPSATAAARVRARLAASLRSSLCRLAERQTSSPSALDLWIARPAVFGPAVLIGSAATLATLDTPRTAPILSTLIPVVGAISAWVGLFEALDYIGSRWPWADVILLWACLLFSVAAIVAGFALSGRVVTFPLESMGLWSLFGLVGSWWQGRRKGGQT